jgi:hypothetical protein
VAWNYCPSGEQPGGFQVKHQCDSLVLVTPSRRPGRSSQPSYAHLKRFATCNLPGIEHNWSIRRPAGHRAGPAGVRGISLHAKAIQTHESQTDRLWQREDACDVAVRPFERMVILASALTYSSQNLTSRSARRSLPSGAPREDGYGLFFAAFGPGCQHEQRLCFPGLPRMALAPQASCACPSNAVKNRRTGVRQVVMLEP